MNDRKRKDQKLYAIMGRNIAKARKSRGLKQVEFARALGMTQQDLRRYEVGERMPRWPTIIEMKKLLEVSLDRLFFGQDAPRQRQTRFSVRVKRSFRRRLRQHKGYRAPRRLADARGR
jgi:transcriptional regulator with XRE-family HTH domain